MANGTELRGIALEILLEITQEKEYSHLAIRNALNKVQYLPKQAVHLSTGLWRELWNICSGSIMF